MPFMELVPAGRDAHFDRPTGDWKPLGDWLPFSSRRAGATF
jgi:hypothetical protein